MNNTDLERISAETNTIDRLEPQETDAIFLLRSDTASGQECAELLKAFLRQSLGLKNIKIRKLPGIHYQLDQGSSLEQMGRQLKQLILDCKEQKQAVTLAATGGFKAEAMILSVIGHQLSVPVCYVHEQYRSLIYLPYFQSPDPSDASPDHSATVSLPFSGRPRDTVMNVSDVSHHRPRTWTKVAQMLKKQSWIDQVSYDPSAFSAPQNGVKTARNKNQDGCYCFWLHLYDDENHKIAVTVETTGHTEQHREYSILFLREQIGRLC
ncbi:putative CRISPR-associated protein [Lyngbya confervoides]|uniref:CRISPR-associated protein n=1 Tax=Lyngbya confervoides BDU141951 TaxID=1574623 RepID=A0ABD4T4S9_9CYAN|nr:putative CRISPR-associated protein [Lyngbya confervoides]MCM1983656.1 putative CRISPR-associated protein [Lyngbya confervoides BDU141951]